MLNVLYNWKLWWLGKIKQVNFATKPSKSFRKQVELRKQKFHDVMKKVFEPVTKTTKDVSENVTKLWQKPVKRTTMH